MSDRTQAEIEQWIAGPVDELAAEVRALRHEVRTLVETVRER